MKQGIILIIFFCLSCSSSTDFHGLKNRDIAFVSKHATEAILTFSHKVEMESTSQPNKADAIEQVNLQVQHLFGPMERSDISAVPKEDHSIKIISILPKKSTRGVYEITYTYKGTIVVEKGPRKYLNITLPVNPSTIYQEAMVGDINPCTDDHYQSEDDFWYFWSPPSIYPDCKLVEGKHYEIIRANIERIKPEAKTTYPEYHRLANNEIIDIHIFFGLDDPSANHDPNKSYDINAENYRRTKDDLLALGFTIKRWNQKEISKIAKVSDRIVPYVEEAIKEFPNKSLKIKVRLFFGETGIDENSKAFHYFLRDSMKNSSIMIYDGHSGLGGHLDIAAIADARNFRINLNKNRYQIFFFNSCTSYTYYNTLYFQRKRSTRGRNIIDPKGTKNLDILANGLSTSFDTMHNTDMSLIKAVNAWAQRGTWISYQRLAKEIDSDNLFTVNGDEDNPRKPVR